MKQPIISIVICTHRRFELLKLAVKSMVNQSAKSDLYEVIVVDNDIRQNKEVKKNVIDIMLFKSLLNRKFIL